MRISMIFALSLCGAGLAPAVLAQSNDVISGEINLAEATENDGLIVHTSPAFDAARTKARARQAAANGDFTTAFGDYLAVCAGSEVTDASSCYRAAEIARENALENVPPSLSAHLYQRACESGHDMACAQVTGEN